MQNSLFKLIQRDRIITMQEEATKFQKLNSFSHRPSAPQITSYLLVLATNLIFWLIIQDKFINQGHRFLVIVLFAMSLVVLLIAGCITSYLDPSDPLLKIPQDSQKRMQQFFDDIEKYLYCEHCNNSVHVSSRHCKQCDRCISKFDHHCVWINSCIGQINYKPFFAMICSAFLHLFIFLGSLGLLFNQNQFQHFLSQMVFAIVFGAVVLIFAGLLLGLIILHSFLMQNSLTTFDYILSKKTEEQGKKFTNIIRVKIQENKAQDEPQESHKSVSRNEYYKTDNELPPPSAFQSMNHNMSEDKSDVPSFECFKQRKQSQTFKSVSPQAFESVFFQKNKGEQDISRVITRHRSLKVFVGDSVAIKSRKDSLYQFQPKRKQKRSSNIKINVLKIDDLVYYTKEQQKLRKNQQM